MAEMKSSISQTLSKFKVQRDLDCGKKEEVHRHRETTRCWSADGELVAARVIVVRCQSGGCSVSWVSRAAAKQQQQQLELQQQPADGGSTLPEGETTSPVAVRTIGALEAG